METVFGEIQTPNRHFHFELLFLLFCSFSCAYVDGYIGRLDFKYTFVSFIYMRRHLLFSFILLLNVRIVLLWFTRFIFTLRSMRIIILFQHSIIIAATVVVVVAIQSVYFKTSFAYHSHNCFISYCIC